MGAYTCAFCGASTAGELCDGQIGRCGACRDWVCSVCFEMCSCDEPVCETCAVQHAPREWACCEEGGGEPKAYHLDCVPEDETEEQHGCVLCGACGQTTCPAAYECLSCAVIAEEAAAAAEEAVQAPLRALDVRTARAALAAARSDSLRNLLQLWLDEHADAADAADAAGAATGAAAKKRKA
jgi:hypothetical protein